MKLLYVVLALVIIVSATTTTYFTYYTATFYTTDVFQLENKVASLESEISSLKSSIASDLKNAYDDGYSAGIAEQSFSSNTSSSNTSSSNSDTVSTITRTIGTVEESGYSTDCAVSMGGDGCYTPVSLSANIGDTIDIEYLNSYLVSNGYLRTETVREPGEYAVRGGIIDIYPAGIENPLRLDLFGDTIEYIRSFDALTQRSISELKSFNLTPANEIIISDGSWEMFRNKYREVFGPVKNNDHLFEAISSKNRHPGMEHWAPLFYESMSSIFDYVSGNIILGLQAEEALISRQELILRFNK